MRVEDQTSEELLALLNETASEVTSLEAKSVGEGKLRSVLETVCSFSNEPGMNGGVILLGVAESEGDDGPRFAAENIGDPDKVQLDLATQCKTVFDKPVYPDIRIERLQGKRVIRITVPELPPNQKPLYFKKDSLPSGAYRRIGSADLRCTAEDIGELYADPAESYDATPLRGATLADVDPLAVKRYRDLRREVNPAAEELSYDTQELLEALQCINPENPDQLTIAGLLLFGSKKALRRLMPMARVDYIRVPGTEWVEDPDESFRSVDMQGSLLLLTYRIIDAVNADLPKGFLLKDKVQADTIGLPVKVLREAIVNALMHGSYREGRPVQVIRYDNRLEIINAGYSLKPEDLLGTPGSVPRNKTISPVFHDTNLAETKGSGIKRMRKLMEEAHLASPTYESDREGNQFTLRLLLHHFLGDDDLAWLERFSKYNLDDGQKKALIFLREAGAVDNRVYRQLSGVETLRASNALQRMRDCGLLTKKGKSRATYYEPGESFWAAVGADSQSLVYSKDALVHSEESLVYKEMSLAHKMVDTGVVKTLEEIKSRIVPRMKNEDLDRAIVDLCEISHFSRQAIAEHLGKKESYLKHILIRLVQEGRLAYTVPEMSTNPHQAYKTVKKSQAHPTQDVFDLI